MMNEQIMAYVLLVRNGKLTLEQVPSNIREEVKKIIEGA